jgi:hypothetical protein
VEFPEFRFRLQAFEPDSDEDQRFAFVPRLPNVPEVLRLPASEKTITITFLQSYD